MGKIKNREKILYLIIFILASFIVFHFVGIDFGTEDLEKELEIYFLDVGQGDSILIKSPNKENILIDGSIKSMGESIVRKLEALDVNKIHHLVGTHPHADHIGGLPEVIREIEVEKVYLPSVVNTTKIFEELLLEISNRDIPLIEGKSGVNMISKGNYSLDILGPVREYADINNNSIVIKLVYDDFSALFTGDAELSSEEDLINEGFDIKATLLKVGHHGSNTSTSKEFLELVNPEYAVISLGENNRYNHPDDEVIKRLEDYNVKIFRTDLDGDIYFNIGDTTDIKKNLEI